MTPQQLDDLESKWHSMRHKKLGEIIEMKLSTDSNRVELFLAEMELERRKFVRDVMIDRFIAGISIIIALGALSVSLWSLLSHKYQAQLPAIQSTLVSSRVTNSANNAQFLNTNK
jgi:hypothetical protein